MIRVTAFTEEMMYNLVASERISLFHIDPTENKYNNPWLNVMIPRKLDGTSLVVAIMSSMVCKRDDIFSPSHIYNIHKAIFYQGI